MCFQRVRIDHAYLNKYNIFVGSAQRRSLCRRLCRPKCHSSRPKRAISPAFAAFALNKTDAFPAPCAVRKDIRFILGNTAQFCVLDHRAGRADPLREKRSCYFVYQRAFSQRGRRAMVGETARKL
jgi:hypothetical protein